jgi:hypothetical protein
MAGGKRRPALDKCGAKNRQGTPCSRPAGWGTDHVGQGRCKLHGGASPIKHGRYSKVARAKLSSVLEAIEADPDPLNLLPELQLVRAQAAYFLEKSGPSPMVVDLLAKAAGLVDLIQKHRKERFISLEVVQRVIDQLGVSVARHVKDPTALAAIEREWGAIQLG